MDRLMMASSKIWMIIDDDRIIYLYLYIYILYGYLCFLGNDEKMEASSRIWGGFFLASSKGFVFWMIFWEIR